MAPSAGVLVVGQSSRHGVARGAKNLSKTMENGPFIVDRWFIHVLYMVKYG